MAEPAALALRHGGSRVLLQVEDRALADQRVLLDFLAFGLRRLEHVDHALARRVGGTERAALDQRLDRLLVDGPAVDPLAEVPQRGELAVLAGALDRLHGLVADARARVEAQESRAGLPAGETAGELVV